MLLIAKACFGAAEPPLPLALAINEAAYGTEHPAVAADLNNLSASLREYSNGLERRVSAYAAHWRSTRPPSGLSMRTLDVISTTSHLLTLPIA